MTLKRVAIPSPNYSSRGGAAVTTIVLHTAEGSTSYTSLGNFFANPASGVSSHVGIDDTPNTVGEYVRRDWKAWTAANANPWCVQAELCGFASWDPATWHSHGEMLNNTARWIAEEAALFGIPLQALTPEEAQSPHVAGVCQHVDLGSMGGGHWDCGPAFPLAYVLDLARGGAATPLPPVTPPGSGAAPPFPYPADHYLGQPSPDARCHSGYYGGVDHENVRTWQAAMSARGWVLDVDGLYGSHSEAVCWDFQEEQGLTIDGLCGPQTWAATWA
jgi:hypothetical protein